MFKSTLIKGALILTLANIITRILGFVYRIYMSNTIGAEGMGLYQLITPLYQLVWAISSAGLSTSMSKLTAQELARGKSGNCQKLLFIALVISVSISSLLSVFVHSFSQFIAVYFIKEARTAMSLRLLSVCFPFMAAGSIIRGYFLGTKNTTISAISQVLEQAVRMAAVYILASLMIPKGIEYACGAAVIGMAAGEIISFLYVAAVWLYKSRKTKNTLASLNHRACINMLLAMAIPLTLNRVTTSLFSTTEAFLIPQKLQAYGMTQAEAISILGILNGMAMPLVMFPSSLLTALATATMPVISESHALNQHYRIQRTIKQTMFITAVIAAGTTGLFFTYPTELGMLIYSQPMGNILKMLSLVCPFLYIQVTISGILNGLGEQVFIFRVNIVSSIINIGAIYFLVPIYGINIFILSWIISSAIATLMTVSRLKHSVNLKLHILNSFITPALAMAFACLVSYKIKDFINIVSEKFTICIIILLTGIVYLAIIKIIYESRK